MANSKVRTQIESWNLGRGFGFCQVDGRRVFVHYSVISPRPVRGTDLTGQEILVDGVDWAGSRAVSVLTVEEYERREVAKLAEEQKAAEEAARKLTVGEDGFLYRGGERVTDWSGVRLIVDHRAGRPDKVEVFSEDGFRRGLRLGAGQIEELVGRGLVFRRTCVACRQELLTVDEDRTVHSNGYCDKGDQPHRWEQMIAAVEEVLGEPLPTGAGFEAKFTKPLTLKVQIGEQVFSSEEFLADRCSECGDRLEIEEGEGKDGGIKFDVCVRCGWRAKRFPTVRLVSGKVEHYWEIRFRDFSGSHDTGYGWNVTASGVFSADYAKDYPNVEIRQQLVELLEKAGAAEEFIAATRPVEADSTVQHVCPECGAPVVRGYKSPPKYSYSYRIPGAATGWSEDGMRKTYDSGTTVSSAQVKSGTFYQCPNGHGTWWDEASVLNPNRVEPEPEPEPEEPEATADERNTLLDDLWETFEAISGVKWDEEGSMFWDSAYIPDPGGTVPVFAAFVNGEEVVRTEVWYGRTSGRPYYRLKEDVTCPPGYEGSLEWRIVGHEPATRAW